MQRIYIPYILRWVYTHSCMHNKMLICWKHVKILVWMCFCLAVGMELVLLVLDEVCAIPWGWAVLKSHYFIQGHPSGMQKRKIISLTPGWNPSVHETCVFCMFGRRLASHLLQKTETTLLPRTRRKCCTPVGSTLLYVYIYGLVVTVLLLISAYVKIVTTNKLLNISLLLQKNWQFIAVHVTTCPNNEISCHNGTCL